MKHADLYEHFANEYVVSLFPIYMLSNASVRGLKKLIGAGVQVPIRLEKNAVTYYIRHDKWQAVHEAIVRKVRQSPKFLANAFREMEKRGNALIAQTARFRKDLVSISNAALWRSYERFVADNTRMYAYGLLLPYLDFKEKAFLTDEVHKILNHHEAQKEFVDLTIPLRWTNNKQQEVNLLRLLGKIQKSKELTRLLRTLPTSKFLESLIKHYPLVYRALQQHTRKYGWVFYVYEGPAMGAEYFVDALRGYVRRGVNGEKTLANETRQFRLLRQKQQTIYKKYKFTPAEIEIIEYARDSVFVKPYRRELQSHAYYHMEFLFRETGKRLGLSLAQLRMMLPQELKNALLRGRVDADELNDRLKLTVYSFPQVTSVLTGKKADGFIKHHIKKEPSVRFFGELRGTIAYKGKVRGIVRLINTPAEMTKMRSQDILVASTTNPNLMPAIRQAAALVTDEGGLTCHAAIVSRELKIPCVVGVGIATKVFKDGDRIEVDANKGTVKKL